MPNVKDLVIAGLNIASIPMGKNTMSTKQLFAERKHYKLSVLPPVLYSSVEDNWTDKINYGKVDSNSYVVLPKFSRLKQLEGDNKKSQFAIAFAADAFNELRNYMINAMNYGKGIERDNTIFKQFEATSGYVFIDDMYNMVMQKVIEIFHGSLISTAKYKKIRSVEEYVAELRKSIDFLLNSNTAFTKTQFVASRACPLNCSGMVIEVATIQYSDDKVKYDKIIADPNFQFYVDAARRHGFTVDKNAPQRLLFDIASPAAKQYLEKQFLVKDIVFDFCYEKVYNQDVELLKTFFYKAYSKFSLIAKKPCVPDMSREIFLSKFNDDIWLQYYLEIRFKEMHKDRTSKEILQMIRSARAIEKQYSIEKMMEYLNQTVGPYSVISIR